VSRANPPHDRGKRRTSAHDSSRHATDDGPTATDGPRIGDDLSRQDATNVDGPRVAVPTEAHDTVSNKLSLDSSQLMLDSAVSAAIGALQSALLAGPVLTFEGKSGERFGGDLERVGTTLHVCVQLGDGSLGEGWPKGALLGFLMDASPAPGDVVLLRHQHTKQLGLRRATAQAWAPLAPWQPAYPRGGDWLSMARLSVLLPRA
jgi:hypothetical protein